MSAELVPHSGLPARMAALPATTSRVQAIIPATLDDAFRLGSMIFASGLAPYSLKSKEAVCAAVMYGMEIGLPPMQAVQSIAVIGGKPAIFGDAAIALVRQSGLLAYIRERVEGEGNARVGICEVGRRNQDGTIEEIVERFSVEQAKAAGLWDKRGRNGEATPWQLYPERMLRFRARGFALRDMFADVLKGLRTVEEVEDMDRAEVPAVPTPPAPPPAALAPPTPPEVVRAPPSPPVAASENSQIPTPPAPPPARSSRPYADMAQPEPAYEPPAARDWLADFESDLSAATNAEAFDEIAAPYLAELSERPMADRTKAQAIYERHALKWSEIAP